LQRFFDLPIPQGRHIAIEPGPKRSREIARREQLFETATSPRPHRRIMVYRPQGVEGVVKRKPIGVIHRDRR
jgi:hypothetical protein